MAIELFTQKSARSQLQPRMSISKQGLLHLNSACLKERFEEIFFVHLLFDAESRQIAVRPAKAEDAHTYKLSRNKQSGGYVSGQAFLKSNEVAFEKTRAYPATWNDEVGAVVISLGKGSLVKGSLGKGSQVKAR